MYASLSHHVPERIPKFPDQVPLWLPTEASVWRSMCTVGVSIVAIIMVKILIHNHSITYPNIPPKDVGNYSGPLQ